MNTPSICSESPRAVAGLDVSKDTLDICLLADGKRHEKQFVNDKAGHRELLRWSMKKVDGNVADQLGPTAHFCMEATGSYGQGVASFLMEQQQVVSIINPARIRFFGLAQNAGNKTDKADARLIALYCLQQNPVTSRAHAPEIVRLQAFVRRIHALNELIVQEKNRVQVPGQEKEIIASNKRILTLLEKEKKRLQTQLRAHVSRHEKLLCDIQLLQSIPGIGEITA